MVAVIFVILFTASSAPPSSKKKITMVAVIFVMVFVLMVDFSIAGEVYKVGDSAGWTIMGTPNYTDWSRSKNFQVGDIIWFEYNKHFHNVKEVSKEDYKSCNANSPLATYTSGNDSIALKRKGHYFFLCGIPGHCQIGQKVDIRILKTGVATSPISIASAPSMQPIMDRSSPPMSHSNRASSNDVGCLWLVVVMTAAVAASVF